MTPGGLGRGLAALIPPRRVPSPSDASASVGAEARSAQSEDHRVLEIPLDQIERNPQQPRVEFSESELQDLTQSIREHGILQPLLVTHEGSRYIIVAGERRFKAAKRAGLTTVPCIVHETIDDRERLELALIENLQRADLNPVEQALAYRRLHEEFGLSHEEIARAVGKERPSVSNTIRLLDLPEEMQAALREGKITFGQAKGLLAAKEPERRQELFAKLLKGEMTREGLERINRRVNVSTYTRQIQKDPELAMHEQELSRTFGTRVRIKKIAGGGTIEIEYYSDEELSGLLDRLKGAA